MTTIDVLTDRLMGLVTEYETADDQYAATVVAKAANLSIHLRSGDPDAEFTFLYVMHRVAADLTEHLDGDPGVEKRIAEVIAEVAEAEGITIDPAALTKDQYLSRSDIANSI
ncbi:hypothetical protein [Aeromicrobium sp. 179-A 4D2 NHS]|uniref:hypothetical protein n=1 Tax=Aeromicrobium sp. 179-A 4D2 NHS TaxID=3142375 RepID=UPI0039A0A28B